MLTNQILFLCMQDYCDHNTYIGDQIDLLLLLIIIGSWKWL